MTTLAPENGLAGTEVDPYSDSALGRLWASTYLFAQGSATLQHDIVGLLFRQVLPPNVREDYERLERSFAVARPLVRRRVNSVEHAKYTNLPQGTIDRNFKSDVEDVIRNAGAKPELGGLLEKILQRDGRYLPSHGNKIPRTYGTQDRRYYSHAVKYILLGARTPHPSLDLLCRQARPSFVPLADKNMGTSVSPRYTADYPVLVPRRFTLQEVVTAHIVDNDRDLGPVRDSLAELGISSNISI